MAKRPVFQDPAALKKALKDFVGKNITIRKVSRPGYGSKWNTYHVFMRFPSKRFFEGASEEEKEFAKTALLGDEAKHNEAHRHFETHIVNFDPKMKCPGVHLGYIEVRLIPKDREAHIQRFFPLSLVTDRHRKRGVGTKVLGHILKDLKKEGAEKVIVHKAARAAFPLYESYGFEFLPNTEPFRKL